MAIRYFGAPASKRLRTQLIGMVLIGVLLTVSLGYHLQTEAHRDAATTSAQLAQARAKLKHIVFVILENHTFDSVFGRYPGADGAVTAAVAGKGTVPLVHGPLFGWHDIGHDRADYLTEMNGGKMDGFAKVSGANLYGDQMAFWQLDQRDIPDLWRYAQEFTLGDHMFSSVVAPTFPNRLFTLAAQNGGIVGNPHYWQVGWGCDSGPQTMTQQLNASGDRVEYRGAPCFDFPTLADSLQQAQRTWTFYGAPRTDLGYLFTTADAFRSLRSTPLWKQHVVDEQQFASDARSGTLPFFSWITPRYAVSAHPPFSMGTAESWFVNKMNALMQGPDWDSTAVVLTFDTSGGYYDHVVPPVVNGSSLGMRVPLLIITPYAKHGYISHTIYTHGSVLKTAEELAGLAPLTAFDTQANDLLDAFDFSQHPRAPLMLTPHVLAAGPAKSQYTSYLRAAFTQTVRSLLRLSMAEIVRRHATRTLAQIAAERKVSLAAVTKALNDDVSNLNFVMQGQGAMSNPQIIVTAHEYAAKIATLLQTKAGKPLSPLLGTDQDVTLLPSAKPFTGGTAKTLTGNTGASQRLQAMPPNDPS